MLMIARWTIWVDKEKVSSVFPLACSLHMSFGINGIEGTYQLTSIGLMTLKTSVKQSTLSS